MSKERATLSFSSQMINIAIKRNTIIMFVKYVNMDKESVIQSTTHMDIILYVDDTVI